MTGLREHDLCGRTQKPVHPARMFSSLEVMRLTRSSLRQLQWWDERGVTRPQIIAHRRKYSYEEVLEIFLISALRDKGLPLQRMRRGLTQFYQQSGHTLGKAATVLAPGFMLCDQKGRLAVSKDAAMICRLAIEINVPVWIVEIPRLDEESEKPC